MLGLIDFCEISQLIKAYAINAFRSSILSSAAHVSLQTIRNDFLCNDIYIIFRTLAQGAKLSESFQVTYRKELKLSTFFR